MREDPSSNFDDMWRHRERYNALSPAVMLRPPHASLDGNALSSVRLTLLLPRWHKADPTKTGRPETCTLCGTCSVPSQEWAGSLIATCPDFKIRKGNICKHYLYVMLRVLRLRQDDPLVWQKALLLSEAEEVSTFRTCSHVPSLHASRPSSSAYMFLERY